AAVASSINKKNLDAVLVAALKSGPGSSLLERLLNLATALGHRRATVTLLNAVASPEKDGYATWQFAALAALLDGLAARNSSLKQLAREGDAPTQEAVGRLAKLFDAARKTAADGKAPTSRRLQAISLLARGLDDPEADIRRLGELLSPRM